MSESHHQLLRATPEARRSWSGRVEAYEKGGSGRQKGSADMIGYLLHPIGMVATLWQVLDRADEGYTPGAGQ